MELTSNNYYTTDANKAFWSVSQYKAFDRCEACGLAQATGEYEREATEALMVGSYIDAYFAGEMDDFIELHPEIFNKRTGELKSAYSHADTIINRIESSELMMEYLDGDKQRIFTAELFDVPWKIKTDVYRDDRICDLKIVKDMNDIWDDKDGYRKDWINYWGYDIQGAIYQKVEQIATGRTEPLPFYLVVATKEKTPDIAVIQIPQHVLDMALNIVESKIERYDLIKQGLVEPMRCEHCDYCKSTKVLTEPTLYVTREERTAE